MHGHINLRGHFEILISLKLTFNKIADPVWCLFDTNGT